MKTLIKSLSIGSLFLLLAFGLSAPASAATSPCVADPTWLTSPSFPQEVEKSGLDGTSNFCDFYQFSWQAYLYLMTPSPSDSNPNRRNFQVLANYPLLEFDEATGYPVNSCDETVTGATIKTALDKTSTTTGQAGDGATIFAQDGNVIYYDVRFDKETCYTTGSAVVMEELGVSNFPPGTTELKFAWKVLSESEISSGTFVTQLQEIESQNVTLGLVGMHIVIATEDHPEFIWATFERNVNSPNCDGETTSTGWMFANESCTAGLPGTADSSNSCKFNKATPQPGVTFTKTPTNICRVYPDGTVGSDPNDVENRTDINALNAEVGNLLAGSNVPAMKLLTNYFNVGDLWVSDITKDSYDADTKPGSSKIPNQRGSLQLANTVAETTYQDIDITDENKLTNCFGCHNYLGTADIVNNNVTSLRLSHIFADILAGQGKSIDVDAGPIWSNEEASDICSYISDTKKGVCQTAEPFLQWNGNWTTTVPGIMSVCGCELAD